MSKDNTDTPQPRHHTAEEIRAFLQSQLDEVLKGVAEDLDRAYVECASMVFETSVAYESAPPMDWSGYARSNDE